jgi:hypothetical protein
VKLRTFLLIGGLLALAPACAISDVVIAPTSYYPGYTPTVLNYAAAKGGMLIQVRGNPFEQATDEQLQSEIARVMASSYFGPRLPFITTAPDDFASPYRVVVVFDPAQTVSSFKVCDGRQTSAADRPEGMVRVHAVLCANEKPLTAVAGQARDVETPGDANFRRLIGQMSILLFPPNLDRGDRRDRGIFPD